jgi:hypothetical protein
MVLLNQFKDLFIPNTVLFVFAHFSLFVNPQVLISKGLYEVAYPLNVFLP